MTNSISRSGRILVLALSAAMALASCQSAPAAQVATPQVAPPEASRNSVEPPSPSMVALRWNLLNPAVESLYFHNMDELFETRWVKPAPVASVLQNSPEPLPSYTFNGTVFTYEEFAERTMTNAFLVIRDGQITFEDYRNRTRADDRFASFSMAKSIVSVLVGIAIEKGAIRTVDDLASAYVPELKGTGYEGVSLRHILQMRSGVAYEERYDFGENPSLAAQVHENAIVLNRARFTDAVSGITGRDAPGSRFNYATMDTAVLGRVLEAASGRPLAEITQEWLWQPAGMEHGGFWIADGPEGVGRELAGMGYNATLRDFGRLGLLMLNGGHAGERAVIPEAWVKDATQMIAFKAGESDDIGKGYGYQWWQLDDEPGAFAAVGLAGQFIYVHPASRTVVVKLSYFPVAEQAALTAESVAFFGAIAAANMR